MSDMRGNPYWNQPEDDQSSEHQRLEAGLRSVAYEMRTANLLALSLETRQTADSADDYALAARLRIEASGRLGLQNHHNLSTNSDPPGPVI